MAGVNRPSFTKEYKENILTYYKLKYPNVKDEDILSAIDKIIAKKIYKPKAEIIKHTDFNSEIVKVDLYRHLLENMNKVITPSGTYYQTHDQKEAPDIKFMENRLEARSKHKKAMLKYREAAQFDIALLEEFRQQMIKIGTNSVIGGSGTEHSILFDLENFNGITSIARHDIMLAYVFTERFLANNVYLPSESHTLNYLITQIRICPNEEDILKVVNKHNLYIPTSEDLFNSLLESMSVYFEIAENSKVKSFIDTLPDYLRVYLLYNCNLYNLFKYNNDYFKKWLSELFNIEQVECNPDIEPHSTEQSEVKPISKAFDGELFQLTGVYSRYVINGKKVSTLHEDHPEVAKHVLSIGNYLKDKLKEVKDIFNMFFVSRSTVPLVDEMKDFTRRVVILSDTDSVIFTTIPIIRWYFDNIKVTDESSRLAAFVTYMLSKGLASIVGYISYYRGATGEYTKMMNIKNEFTYSSLVRTDIAKHYFGKKTVQEGVTLPEADYDIKGVQFKSSTLPKITNDFTERLIKKSLTELEEHGNISVNEFIWEILNYEKIVYTSVMDGELLYVNSQSVKNKAEYADPDRSVYKWYEVWEKVFSDKYGHIHIPTKVPVISFNNKSILTNKVKDHMFKVDEKIANKLYGLPEELLKKMTRMLLSGTVEKIPEELIPAMNIRSIIYANIKPAHLVMKSFKIDLNNTGKKQFLYLDIYNNLNIE